MATMTQWRGAIILALLLSVANTLACSEDLVDIPETLFGEPVCMIALSRGHWEDGTAKLILDESRGLSPAGCACVPREERGDEETLDMLAELALAECERMAEALYDFDWNDCRADFDADAWDLSVLYVGPGSDEAEAYAPPDLHCIDEEP